MLRRTQDNRLMVRRTVLGLGELRIRKLQKLALVGGREAGCNAQENLGQQAYGQENSVRVRRTQGNSLTVSRNLDSSLTVKRTLDISLRTRDTNQKSFTWQGVVETGCRTTGSKVRRNVQQFYQSNNLSVGRTQDNSFIKATVPRVRTSTELFYKLYI